MITYFSYGRPPNNIVLDMVELHGLTEEAIYDGPTFLWDRILLHLSGVYSPDATSYFGGFAQGVGRAATQKPGQIAATTDAAVRHFLSQPQQPLLLAIIDGSNGPNSVQVIPPGGGAGAAPVGATVWLRSPMPGFATDANLGPKPLHVRVTEQAGGQTMLVELVYEICINECLASPGKPAHIVLSHRWTATDTMSKADGYLTTRHVRGHAILRSDAMLQANLVPDDFRRAFFHPVLGNCQRENVQVTATEDGTALEYSFSDAERMYNITKKLQLNCPGLVDLTATHSAEIDKPGTDDLILAVAGVAQRAADRFVRGSTGSLGLPAAAVGWAAGTVFDVGRTIMQMVPREMHSIIARAFGDRNADYKHLEAAALQFCRSRLIAISRRLGGLGAFIAFGTAWFHVNYLWEDERKVVEVAYRVKQGISDLAAGAILGNVTNAIGGLQAIANANQPGQLNAAQFQNAQNALRAAANPFAGLNQFANRFVAVDESIMPGFPQTGGDSLTTAFFHNPAPANSGGTRGTLVELLVAQALQSPCGLPRPPGLYGPALPVELSRTV